MQEINQELLSKKIDFFYKNKKPVHVITIKKLDGKKLFFNGMIKSVEKEHLFFSDIRMGEVVIFLSEIFDLQLYSTKLRGEDK